MAQSTVVQLLTSARQGDADAREALFERCRNYVSLVARNNIESWLRSKVDASDIVQQTMLEAHRCFTDFQGGTEAEWLAWLRRILVHNSQDAIRRYRTDKRQVQNEVALDANFCGLSASFQIEPAANIDTPSAIVRQKETEIELADAITQLPDDYQEVIILRNLQRLPFDQVAERMGRSRPAVQMLWLRALRKLEQHLSHADDEA
jgi:RNA polymerase sigma-70 factor, ECF subfamily